MWQGKLIDFIYSGKLRNFYIVNGHFTFLKGVWIDLNKFLEVTTA